LESNLSDLVSRVSDILSEGSERKPAFPNILSKLSEHTDRNLRIDLTLCLLGVQGENHLVFEDDTAGESGFS
jgi:hypothetical protein